MWNSNTKKGKYYQICVGFCAESPIVLFYFFCAEISKFKSLRRSRKVNWHDKNEIQTEAFNQMRKYISFSIFLLNLIVQIRKKSAQKREKRKRNWKFKKENEFSTWSVATKIPISDFYCDCDCDCYVCDVLFAHFFSSLFSNVLNYNRKKRKKKWKILGIGHTKWWKNWLTMKRFTKNTKKNKMKRKKVLLKKKNREKR